MLCYVLWDSLVIAKWGPCSPGAHHSRRHYSWLLTWKESLSLSYRWGNVSEWLSHLPAAVELVTFGARNAGSLSLVPKPLPVARMPRPPEELYPHWELSQCFQITLKIFQKYQLRVYLKKITAPGNPISLGSFGTSKQSRDSPLPSCLWNSVYYCYSLGRGC